MLTCMLLTGASLQPADSRDANQHIFIIDGGDNFDESPQP